MKKLILIALFFIIITGCATQDPLRKAIINEDNIKAKELIARKNINPYEKDSNNVSAFDLVVKKYGVNNLPEWADTLYKESQEKAANMAAFIFMDLLADYGLANVLKRNEFYIDAKIKENHELLSFIGKQRLKYDGHTLLSLLVIEKQDLGYVEKLINAGANVDVLDNKKTAALFYAVGQQNKEAVKILLAAGANPNQDSEEKFLPISMAVLTGNIEILAMLVNAGADLNLTSGIDDGPLFMTVFPSTSGNRKNDLKIARALVNSGADIHAINKHNQSLIHVARINNRPEMVEFFIRAKSKH